MPGKPRLFFEQVIRDNLGAGRPDQVSLIFGRRLGGRYGEVRTSYVHMAKSLGFQRSGEAEPGPIQPHAMAGQAAEPSG